MTAASAETREALRQALIDAFVVERGLPPDIAKLLDQMTQAPPTPPAPARRRLFGLLR